MFPFNFTKRATGVSTLAVIALLGLGACQSDSNDEALPNSFDQEVVDAKEDGHTNLNFDKVDEGEITDHLDDLGVNWENAEEVTITRPDGVVEELIQVEGDLLFTKEQYADATSPDELKSRQYRTRELVRPRTLSIIGYTGGNGNGLADVQRTGLRWAVDNYNALGLSIRFDLRYAAATNADIVVYRDPSDTGAGGSAGFPSNGNPNKFVRILAGMDRYDNNTNEHVIGHEIGHSIGFRHTDYFSRQSCGQNSNEGQAGVGALQIPGTPGGFDATSIMLSCFGQEDGEFGQYDVVSLRFMY